MSKCLLVDFPLSIREKIYQDLLQSNIILTEVPERLSLQTLTTLTPTSTLLDLHLVCRITHDDLSGSVAVPWAYTTFILSGEASRMLLYNAPQAIRRQIRHLEIDQHTLIDKNKYAIAHCFRLQTLKVSVTSYDGILLDHSVAERKATKSILRAQGRTLKVQVTVARSRGDGRPRPDCLEEPREVTQRKMRWNLDRAYPFLFLSQLIPSLPNGTKVSLIGNVSEAGRDVLIERTGCGKGRIGEAGGRVRWTMRYLKDI